MVRELRPVTLLSIPIEIRLRILELSIDDSIVHVAEDGTISCIHDEVVWSYAHRHRCEDQKKPSGIILICRQLFHEAINIFYEKTVLAFACPKALGLFMEQRRTVLSHVRNISIHCGPAKHTTSEQKVQIRLALELIRRCATRLCRLWICLCSYKGIDSDQNLLSNFWLRNLWRLPILKELCLDVQEDLLGPVLFDQQNDFGADQIEKKIAKTCSALQQYSSNSGITPQTNWEEHLSHATITLRGHSRIIDFPTRSL